MSQPPWRITFDSSISLRRPERRAFDRLRECVLRTTATEPQAAGDESGSDEESGDSGDNAPPTFLRNVVLEAQVGKEYWQTTPFNVMGGGVQRVNETFNLPPPRRGEGIIVRAIKRHAYQKDALIGEAKILEPTNGVQRVTLMRKGKDRGVVRLDLVDPARSREAALRVPTGVPEPGATHEEPGSVPSLSGASASSGSRASGGSRRSPEAKQVAQTLVGSRGGDAGDAVFGGDTESDEDAALLSVAERGLVTSGSRRSLRFNSFAGDWADAPRLIKRHSWALAFGVLAVVLAFVGLRLFFSGMARRPIGGALLAATPGMLEVGAPDCIELRVTETSIQAADAGSPQEAFRRFHYESIGGRRPAVGEHVAITNLRTGHEGFIVPQGRILSVADSSVAVEVGDRLSSCAGMDMDWQLSTDWGGHALCMDYNHWPTMGQNVIMHSCNGMPNQAWHWDQTGERLKNRYDNRYCLKHDVGDRADSHNVRVTTCSDEIEQRWYWTGKELRSRKDDGCLSFDWEGNHPGPRLASANVYVHTCSGHRHQAWFIHRNRVPCGDEVAENRGGASAQVARRCMPTYDPTQKVDVFHLEASMRTGPGNYHTGLRLRGACELVNRPFIGFDAADASTPLQEAAYRQGATSGTSDGCFAMCASSCCCSAWVWRSDYLNIPNCFLFQRNTGVGPRNPKAVFGYLEAKDPYCVRDVADYALGAKDLMATGAVLPLEIDIAMGEVNYNTEAIETQLVVHRPCPARWWWDHAVTNIGSLSGAQANAFSDWTSVPDEGRAETSPVAKSDDNYVSKARQYNANSAYSTAPPYCQDDSCAPLEYLPSTKSDDYVLTTLRWASSQLGLVLTPVPGGTFCYGDGCSRTEIGQSRFGTFVTGSALPRLLGAHAGRDCAEWWTFVVASSLIVTETTTVESWLKSMKKTATGLVYDGLAQKACIYKDSLWWATPLNLSSSDFLGWGIDSPQWYQHMPYSCPAYGGCADDECSAYGYAYDGAPTEVCIKKATYSSPEPFHHTAQVWTERRLESVGDAPPSKVPLTKDYIFELVFAKFMEHNQMVLGAIRDSGEYQHDFKLLFNPLVGFVDDNTVAGIGGLYEGPYAPKSALPVGPYEETRLAKLEKALRPIWEQLRRNEHVFGGKLSKVDTAAMEPYQRDFAIADTINRIALAMRPYRATPWGRLQPYGGRPAEHYPLDYRDFPLQEQVTSQRRATGELTMLNAHSGDLLEHSKWTAMQAAVWIHSKDAWVEGVDPRMVIMASFLHDLGKAGDCAFNCVKRDKEDSTKPRTIHPVVHGVENFEEHCYLDTYSPLKYQSQDDIVHPVYSARFLEPDGDARFWLTCPTELEMKDMWHTTNERLMRHRNQYRDQEFAVTSRLEHWKDAWLAGAADSSGYLTTDQLGQGLGLTQMEKFYLTVASRIHWDLGRMNMRREDPMYLDAEGYLKKFAAVMAKFSECGGEYPGPDCIAAPDGSPLFDCRASSDATLGLLKLCIAVAAADIAGASPSREKSRKGTGEVNFVSDTANAALQLCRAVRDPNSETAHGLPRDAAKLVEEICAAGCADSEEELCALKQRYPGLDPWTTYGFEEQGPGYREELLSMFNNIVSSGGYEGWCDASMDALPEMPKIEFTPVLGSRAWGSEWIRLFVEAIPLTGNEKATCTTRIGFVEGLCYRQRNNKCVARSDVGAPCSVSVPLTLQGDERKRMKIPEEAKTYAYTYTNDNEHFHLGGFAYFDDDGKVLSVNHLSKESAAEDRSSPISFGEPRSVPSSGYNALRSILNQGVKVTEPGFEKYSRYAWVPPGTTPDMPHGGMALMVS